MVLVVGFIYSGDKWLGLGLGLGLYIAEIKWVGRSCSSQALNLHP